MISTMQLPFEIQGHTLYVGTSIGAAVFPDHGDSEVKLLAHADTAMYRAKETGKARCVIYSHHKFNQPEHDVSMEAAMFQGVRSWLNSALDSAWYCMMGQKQAICAERT